MSKIEEQQMYIEIWSKVVETQMHFNEMQVKSRQLGLTFVAAALGVAIVLLSNGNEFAFILPVRDVEIHLHVAVLLVLGAWLALEAVKQLDLNVYHRMLRGAVTFGMDFEENYLKEIFDLKYGMTQSISHFSRFNDAKVEKDDNGKYIYSGVDEVTALDKIKNFYKNTTRFLWGAAVLLFIFTNAPLINSWVFDGGEPHEEAALTMPVSDAIESSIESE